MAIGRHATTKLVRSDHISRSKHQVCEYETVVDFARTHSIRTHSICGLESTATVMAPLRDDTVIVLTNQRLKVQRCTRALPPCMSFSTSISVAIEVSPGVVMASAPWAAPYSTARCGSPVVIRP